jgi:hypothetical protein
LNYGWWEKNLFGQIPQRDISCQEKNVLLEKLNDPKGIPLYSARAAEDPKRNGPSAGVVFSRRAKL